MKSSSVFASSKHGEADLADVVASRGMFATTGDVDPARIGIIGASYGGYRVLAALTLRPDAFKVGVDLFSVSNWVRTSAALTTQLQVAVDATEKTDRRARSFL